MVWRDAARVNRQDINPEAADSSIHLAADGPGGGTIHLLTESRAGRDLLRRRQPLAFSVAFNAQVTAARLPRHERKRDLLAWRRIGSRSMIPFHFG